MNLRENSRMGQNFCVLEIPLKIQQQQMYEYSRSNIKQF